MLKTLMARRTIRALERIADAADRIAGVAEAELALRRIEAGLTPTEAPEVPADEASDACDCVSRWGRAKSGCPECRGSGRVPEVWVSQASDAQSAELERAEAERG